MTPHKAKTIERDSFEFFARLCRTNTGSHFLDSGGFYGYQYNKPLPKKREDAIKITPTSGGLLPFEVSLSLPHLLDAFCITNPVIEHLQHEFEAYCKQPENKLEAWLCLLESFLAETGNVPEQTSDNTYNYESDLDQVLQFTLFTLHICGEKSPRYCIGVQPHCGCDVRGGYPQPQLYELIESDYFLMALRLLEFECNNPKCSLGLNGEPHSFYDLEQKLEGKEVKTVLNRKKDKVKKIVCPCGGEIWVYNPLEY